MWEREGHYEYILQGDHNRAGGQAAPGDLQADLPNAARHHLDGQLQHRLKWFLDFYSLSNM